MRPPQQTSIVAKDAVIASSLSVGGGGIESKG